MKHFVTAACIVLLCPFVAAAQGASDADSKELLAYKLTLPVMKQVVTATRMMISAAKENGEVEKLQNAVTTVMGGPKSLGDIERAIQKEPLIASALKSAGLSAREYASFMLTFFQASLRYSMQKSGALKEAPTGINLDNVKFVEVNQPQVNALVAEFQALSKPKLH